MLELLLRGRIWIKLKARRFNPVKDGVVRWRCADLQARVEDAFGVKLHERTIGKYLAKHGFRRLSVRPEHPKTDPAAQQAFKKTLPAS